VRLQYDVGVPLRLEVGARSDTGSRRTFVYEFDADRSQILLGRRGGVDVLLPDAQVSLVHARIERHHGEYTLIDDGSTNGTLLNGAAVPSGVSQKLKEGDRIGIGDYVLTVSTRARKSGDPRPESSVSLARGMVRDLLEQLGPGESEPHLTVLDGPQTGVVLTMPDVGRTYMLGRAAGNDLRFDDVDMWREHAALDRSDSGVVVRAVGAHALLVNDARVTAARTVRDQDKVTLGATSLRYHDPAEQYLKKLDEEPSAPLTGKPATRSAGWRPTARRPELWLMAAGVLVAIAAIAGIVYFFLF
jgi:pSer/pThr/pTyr-binding forkhead associated (FHA) protein